MEFCPCQARISQKRIKNTYVNFLAYGSLRVTRGVYSAQKNAKNMVTRIRKLCNNCIHVWVAR